MYAPFADGGRGHTGGAEHGREPNEEREQGRGGHNGRVKVTAPFSRATIRTRIIWTIILVASVALATSGAAVWMLDLRSTHADIDDRLVLTRQELRRLADDGIDPTSGEPLSDPAQTLRVYMERSVLGSGEGQLGIVDGAVQWVSAEGVRLRPEDDPELVDRLLAGADADVSSIFTIETADGRYQVLTVPVTDGNTTAVLARVVDLNAAEAGLWRTMRMYASAAAVTMMLVAALAWLGIGRLLRPIWELRNATESIDERDLTTRVRVRGHDDLSALAAAVNRMLDRVQRAVEAQRELLDDVGHELRTPITVVRGHLELIDPDDPDDVRQTSELALDELDRMGTLIDDLLDLARSSQSDFVTPEPTDIEALTLQVFDKACALGDRDWQLGGCASGTAVLDPARITQAWLQLAANAVKYSEEDSRVAIGSEINGSELFLWVEDEGIGIAPEDVERIRLRFARTAEATRHASGAGLGLSIVESIVDAHDGRLAISSEVGRGSVFTLRIPLTTVGETRSAQQKESD
ncbi:MULTISPECIES: cell wall metabolism sensor histidine kinase WalK [unclassified Actinomyces]|uniref:sensor histidine kinase n=1 Tax=unclassified Actinomyces TaxID=2609248 RepID=UPI000D59F484|nr:MULTISPECIES: HAMP domain-containing sensor histidine kinase [unclassified Actinomyces]RAX22928.1 sensor histidine kinase [Actinomyces sp. Z3]RAX24641.1 sensor histidine kinase [Actinomyces sp. Z5]